eukprot:snap_masked-scaffold_15-processed-gene-4.46-mRNA-1 protein AED:1.00 eAED:1.00 QI:0/0/0/0/1/1/2/0/74
MQVTCWLFGSVNTCAVDGIVICQLLYGTILLLSLSIKVSYQQVAVAYPFLICEASAPVNRAIIRYLRASKVLEY